MKKMHGTWNLLPKLYITFLKKITLRKSVKDHFTFRKSRVTYHLSHTPQHPLLGKENNIINVFTCHSIPTFFDHSSKSSWVLSFWRKLSPSAFSLCPSTWFSQPFPRTSSTRRMYADNWRSIWWNKNGYWHKLPELFIGLPAALEHTIMISSFFSMCQPFCCHGIKPQQWSEQLPTRNTVKIIFLTLT